MVHVASIIWNDTAVNFEPQNDAKLDLAPGQVSSRTECEAVAQAMPTHKGKGQHLIGAIKDDIVCVRTANGTVARLRVIKFGKDSVALDATVWRR